MLKRPKTRLVQNTYALNPRGHFQIALYFIVGKVLFLQHTGPSILIDTNSYLEYLLQYL